MTEKQQQLQSLETKRQQKMAAGKPKQAEFLSKVSEYVRDSMNDDMSPKHPLSEIPVIEGTEVRIGEERE